MQIGEFQRTSHGFVGRITTVTLDFEMALIPTDPSDTDNAPNYRAHLGPDGEGPEIGAGWDREGERAGPYVAVQLDDPAFVQPMRANLFLSGVDGPDHHLIWNRPNRRDRGGSSSEERG